jgi:putative nucleotidyltransferase with HDIG domain
MPSEKPQPFAGKRFLLVDDDEALRSAVTKILSGFGAEVLEAGDGKTAQNMIGIETVDLVISDIKMPGCNGIELLHHIRREKPDLPVILTTGFGELKETHEAHELGAKGFLAKPFTREDLSQVIEECIGASQPAPETGATQDLDEDYCKLAIEDFISGKQIGYDIFIRLAQDKYVKIAHEGDNIPVERIRAYRAKNINHLYMRKGDFSRYIGFNIEIAKKLPAADFIPKEKKVNFLKHTGEILLEQFFLNEVDDTVLDSAKNTVETMVSVMFEAPDMAALLQSLNQHSDYLYAHCVGVSFYSSLIARAMKWENPRTLYKVSMAGLLHDIGKKELDPALIQKKRAELTAEEAKLFRSHPSTGAEILSSLRSIPGDIVQIVQQHHENCVGTGWPSGLKKSYIHPMARVVAVADEFCHLVITSPTGEPVPILEALEKIYIGRGQEFDKNVLEALISLFPADVVTKIQANEADPSAKN